MLDIFNTIAGLLTIISFGLYIYEKLKDSKNRQIEKSNVIILKERIRSTMAAIKASATNTHLLVQLGKIESTQKDDMTNMARLLRTELFGTLKQLQGLEDDLGNWKYGELLESISLAERQEPAKEENEKEIGPQ